MQRLLFLSLLVSAAALGTSEGHGATVNISGTHTVPNANVSATNGNYRPFKIDNSVLFDPLNGPITVNGSVDIGSLSNNSSVFVGLIAKAQYDAWVTAGYDPNNTTSDFFGFIDTAYGAFNTLNGGRLGIGQQLSFGNTTQSYTASGIGTLIEDFQLDFNATTFSASHPSGSPVSQAYQDGLNYLNQPTPLPTDWSQGGYAFVGTFFDKLGGAPVIDVTFDGASISDVPEPTSLALFGIGLVGLMGVRTVRRRKATVA